ncbi:CocE/NonD family hydrolase [Antrihabitans cavernicola]|uniref:CocE/NonD family hydrolase n=1 Tax=Antrihabitans cavernicola TaxID=2495913 RepID=A0A5A7SD13_9NOCA|nr:CocE/NonD family hydrolase [Spelaeibacter cavernicola]KAA0023072.1 CocE/NonD family hydrolase [Spelaeibacter cavernicola]
MTLGRTLARTLAFALLTVTTIVVPATATADTPDPASYTWTEAYFPSSSGAEIHADVMRPNNIPAGQKTPVVLTVGAYRSHLLYLTDPLLTRAPSTLDLHVDDFLARGYTYVIADLPGYGGSSGCPDWGGPNERGGVKAAVEWAASQPWSTGKVGMYGLSYEGFTGLMGLAEHPTGLAAVATFEPPADPYAYFFMQGVPYRFTAKPVLDRGVIPSDPVVAIEHSMISQTPGRPDDTDHYRANAVSTPQSCYADFVKKLSNRDPNAAVWKERDLISEIRGNTTPVFLAQGFLDKNTRADRVIDLWHGLANPENKAWFAQMGHQDCFTDCRDTFSSEVMAFFDKHVADRPVAVPGPKVTVGQFDGRWRSETDFPPADSTRVPVSLRTGTYTDRTIIPGPDRDIWTISPPLAADQHLSGAPSVSAQARGPANAPIAAEVYDVAPSGMAVPITRGIAMLGPTGQVNIRMFNQDWPIPRSHRIGIHITNTNDFEWAADFTNARITVDRADAQLPLLADVRHPDLAGGPGPLIAKLINERSIQLPPDLIAAAETPMQFPVRHDG